MRLCVTEQLVHGLCIQLQCLWHKFELLIWARVYMYISNNTEQLKRKHEANFICL